MRNYPVILVPSRAQWFEQVWKSWTTPNSCQLQPQVWFPVLSNCSNSFVRVEPCQVPPQAGFPVVRIGSEIWTTPNSWEIILRSMFPLELRGLDEVREGWTTPNSCQASLKAWFHVLNYGSNRFGRVEPPRTHVKFHRRPGFLCWTMVRTGSEELNHPNSWQIILWSLFILELSVSNRFGKVEPPWTHVMFNCRHGFQCWTVVRTCS